MTGDQKPKLPKGRTLAEFGKLKPAERKLLTSAADGTVAPIGVERPSEGDDDNTVRAEFVRFLALGGDDGAPVHEKGLKLRGAWIEGVLDLEAVETKGSLWLFSSRFVEQPILRDAHIKGVLCFSGSEIPGLSADRLVCDSNLFLRDKFKATGAVRLLGAKIGGNFYCGDGSFENADGKALGADGINIGGTLSLGGGFRAHGEVRFLAATIGRNFYCGRGSFENAGGNALNADGVNVGGNLSLNEGFEANGEVRLVGATIDYNFSCRRGSFENGSGSALSADGIKVGGDLFLDEGFVSRGEVRFIGAKIGDHFSCAGGSFQNGGNRAISADRVTVGGNVSLDQGFLAQGEVSFPSATIGGSFSCGGGSFQNAGKISLNIDRVRVAGHLRLDQMFSAQGEVRFNDATIGGNFSCVGGSFQNVGKDALIGDRVKVDGNLSLERGFAAQGAVQLLGATIGGNLSCRGGSIQNAGSYALVGDRVKVGGNLNLDEGFVAQGEVRLPSAAVGGDFSCSRASFENSAGCALLCQLMVVDGVFFFDSVNACAGDVNLSSARVHSLKDDVDAWSADLVLDGFRYDEFVGGTPTTADARLRWLDKQPAGHCGSNGRGEEFRPQPWLQLRKVLGSMGHYGAAREIGIAFEARKRHCGLIGQTPDSMNKVVRVVYGSAARRFHWLFGALVDYGYRPVRLVLITAIVWSVCMTAFYVGANNGYFAPRDPALYLHGQLASCAGRPSGHSHWRHCAAVPAEYPPFFPSIYALNVMLPVGNLGQEKNWGPVMPKKTGWIGIPLGWGFVMQILVWFETIFGWVASLILVAVVSGLAKKDE